MRFRDKFFCKNSVVSKAGLALILCPLKAINAFIIVIHDSHSLAATTSTCFQHHWITYFFCNFDSFFFIFYCFRITRDDIDTCFFSNLFRLNLISHTHNCFVIGAYKSNAVFFECFSKLFILRKETITGVNCIRFGFFASINDLFYYKVTFCRA